MLFQGGNERNMQIDCFDWLLDLNKAERNLEKKMQTIITKAENEIIFDFVWKKMCKESVLISISWPWNFSRRNRS